MSVLDSLDSHDIYLMPSLGLSIILHARGRWALLGGVLDTIFLIALVPVT